MSADVLLPGCRGTLFACPDAYPPALSREAAMERLIRHLAEVKEQRKLDELNVSEGDELGRLEYLRGPHGLRVARRGRLGPAGTRRWRA